MIVSKFGGTSVGSSTNIRKVINIIGGKTDKCIVIVSAFGGITNLLIEASELAVQGNKKYLSIVDKIQEKHIDIIEDLFDKANQVTCKVFMLKHLNMLKDTLNGVSLLNDLSDKTSAKIMSTGELLSSFVIAEAMKHHGLKVDLADSTALIKTDANFINANVKYTETFSNIQEFFKSTNYDIVVAPGFIASNKKGETTTLGRGGSDFSAAIYANATNAELLEIWTDVSGMYTANPSLVEQAKPIDQISYLEAMELSHFGAKVIYPPTIQPVLDKKIPIIIKNTLQPEDKGTLIVESANNNESTIKGISHIEDIALLTLEGNGMIGVPGISKRLFEALFQVDINVKFITQASSEHSICIAIDIKDAEKAKKAVDKQFELEILQHKVYPLAVETELAIIALVGDNMKSHQGISGKMFSCLGNNNVNIRAIAQGSTEKNISAVIAKRDVKKAINSLHSAFFEDQIKQINLFITGVGNVGSILLEQIKKQQKYILDHLHINMRVIGISNSRKMLFDAHGIDLGTWSSQIEKSEEVAGFDDFLAKTKKLNLRNSVFVDNTANDELPLYYKNYLKHSIAVIACNKIACSSDYRMYKNLKTLSRQYNAPFLFETNVGAGLPIIDTLQNLINSGDEVTKIQAVLSGSLNFIFNNFDDEHSFYDVVEQAGIEGYTEPDPRIDLSGVDVMRKILILLRESGMEMELEDIKNKSFLPKSSLEANSVDQFLKSLKNEADHFESLRKDAELEDCRLKYVAEYKDGTAEVGLQHIPKDHPFYNLDGKDNIVLFYTNRYKDQPLIIKGAGAGAEVTASGIFGDIIRTANM